MRIKLNLQIFIFILIFILTKQIETYAILMLFAFIHEMGHIIIGLIVGLKPIALSIMPFGIAVTLEDKKTNIKSNKEVQIKKVIVALAGPLTNVAIMGVAIFFENQLIVFSNLLIALFNLIPIYPLDGGRILKCLLRLKYNREKADSFINKSSNALVIAITALASILVIYLKNFAVIFIIVYLWYIVIRENRQYKIKKRMYEIIKMSNKKQFL